MDQRTIEYLGYMAYALGRFMIHFTRNICWSLNGTSQRMQDSKLERNYDKSAHIMSVVGRHSSDSMSSSGHYSDFILLHNNFAHPTIVLQDDVTLYHVTEREAVFVRCKGKSSVWDDTSFSTSGEAQFRRATQVIVLPMPAAYRLAEDIGRPRGKLVFLQNVAHSGSALLTDMFSGADNFVTYTMPLVTSIFAPRAMLSLAEHENDPWAAKHVTTVLSLLCKPRQDESTRVHGHVLKLSASVARLQRFFYKQFPDAYFVQLYRDEATSYTQFSDSPRLALPEWPGQIMALIKKFVSVFTTVCQLVLENNNNRQDGGGSKGIFDAPGGRQPHSIKF